MTPMLWLWWAVAAAVTLSVFIALVKGGRPVRGALSSGIQGFGALLAVNVAGIFTGVSVGVNALTAATCFLLGAPGVVALLLLKAVFRIG